MLGKLNQKIEENGLAVQAGRDVNVGMSFTEVEHLFNILFESNFPRLQEIAVKAAKDNIKKFMEILKGAFIRNSFNIDLSKIADPDVQYMFNDIMKSSARKGDKIDAEILSKLIIQRLSNDSTEIINTICTEAAEVIPKLSGQQIAFITLIQFINNITYPEFHDVAAFEGVGSLIEQLIIPCETISETSIDYLMYMGVLTKSTIFSNNIYNGIKDEYSFLNGKSEGEIKKEFEIFAPSYHRIIILFDKCKAYQTYLTSIGKMIALININRVLELDYRNWIN